MRRGTSLIEAVVFLAIGLVLLALIAIFHARLTRHDTWNAARLTAAESLLIALEHVQLDIACAGAGRVTPGEDRRMLRVERSVSARGDLTEIVDYEVAVERTCRRAGRTIGGIRLDAMEFGWKDEASSLLSVRLASGGDRIEAGGVAHLPSELHAQVHVSGRARRAEFPSWVDGE